MSIILHITPRQQWHQAQVQGVYEGDTLTSEGFIHCSTPQQVVTVANTWFPGQQGLVLLCIDAALVQPEIRYEAAPGGESYPHIYGPLNLDAVRQVLDFVPDAAGQFQRPPELQDIS